MADNELLPVTRADITEADRMAAAWHAKFRPGDIGWGNYMSGRYDDCSDVIAFARHRLATTDNAELVGALAWYAEQVAGCRKLGSIGDPFRHALDRDGGERARTALARTEQQP
jgi:hypothetical protein